MNEHLEVKIILNLKDHQKEDQDDHQTLNQLIMLGRTIPNPQNQKQKQTQKQTQHQHQRQKAKAKAKANPSANTRRPQHDTDLINNIDLEFWGSTNLTTIRDQLNKRGFRKHKTANGKRMNKPDYLEEVFKMINEGRWII